MDLSQWKDFRSDRVRFTEGIENELPAREKLLKTYHDRSQTIHTP
jgi:hypothetical protein